MEKINTILRTSFPNRLIEWETVWKADREQDKPRPEEPAYSNDQMITSDDFPVHTHTYIYSVQSLLDICTFRRGHIQTRLQRSTCFFLQPIFVPMAPIGCTRVHLMHTPSEQHTASRNEFSIICKLRYVPPFFPPVPSHILSILHSLNLPSRITPTLTWVSCTFNTAWFGYAPLPRTLKAEHRNSSASESSQKWRRSEERTSETMKSCWWPPMMLLGGHHPSRIQWERTTPLWSIRQNCPK